MRERRKEPREGSEIDPETACIQTVGAPPLNRFAILSGSLLLQKTEDRGQRTEGVSRRDAFNLSSVFSLQSSDTERLKHGVLEWRSDGVPFV